jgi:hypothetical protein
MLNLQAEILQTGTKKAGNPSLAGRPAFYFMLPALLRN